MLTERIKRKLPGMKYEIERRERTVKKKKMWKHYYNVYLYFFLNIKKKRIRPHRKSWKSFGRICESCVNKKHGRAKNKNYIFNNCYTIKAQALRSSKKKKKLRGEKKSFFFPTSVGMENAKLFKCFFHVHFVAFKPRICHFVLTAVRTVFLFLSLLVLPPHLQNLNANDIRIR